MQSMLGVLHEEPILLDKHGNPHQSFHGVHGRPTEGGDTDPHVVLAVEHKYYVVVFDKVAKEWHYDDPKIIVGKGSPVPPSPGKQNE